MKLKSIAVAVALASSAAGALSASVTLSGSTFDVTYDSALVGLFGTPTLIGDVLSWFPSGSPGFTAQTSGGISVTNSTFAMTVAAKPGYYLASFGLGEGGDYFYFGTGAGVAVSGQLRVTPLPGSVSSTPIAPTTTFSSNVFPDFSTDNWAASSAPINAPAMTTLANVSVQNILAAYANPSEFPSYAFIEKKEAFLTVSTVPVPEPETYAMMLAGLGVIGFLASRRRRQG
jgi:hypothetical protein